MYCKIATRRSFRLYFLFLKLVRVVAAPICFKKNPTVTPKTYISFWEKKKNMFSYYALLIKLKLLNQFPMTLAILNMIKTSAVMTYTNSNTVARKSFSFRCNKIKKNMEKWENCFGYCILICVRHNCTRI